jgi:hypothetical protein
MKTKCTNLAIFFLFKFFKNLFLGGGRHHLLYSLFWVFLGWKWGARQRVLGKTRALRRLKMVMNSIRKGGGHMLCWVLEECVVDKLMSD